MLFPTTRFKKEEYVETVRSVNRPRCLTKSSNILPIKSFGATSHGSHGTHASRKLGWKDICLYSC